MKLVPFSFLRIYVSKGCETLNVKKNVYVKSVGRQSLEKVVKLIKLPLISTDGELLRR